MIAIVLFMAFSRAQSPAVVDYQKSLEDVKKTYRVWMKETCPLMLETAKRHTGHSPILSLLPEGDVRHEPAVNFREKLRDMREKVKVAQAAVTNQDLNYLKLVEQYVSFMTSPKGLETVAAGDCTRDRKSFMNFLRPFPQDPSAQK